MFFIIRKMRSLILWIFRVVRRAFCCFRMRGTFDETDDTSESLTHIGVIPNRTEQDSWSTQWGEQKADPHTVEEHIQSYREKLNAAPTHDPMSDAIDNMFHELEPQVIKQKKIIVENENSKNQDISENVDLSRLSAINNFSNELGEWMEESSSGWDEQQLDPNDFIRQQKRSSNNRNKLHTTKLAA